MSRTCPRQRALERLRSKEIDLKTYNRIMAALDRADESRLVRAVSAAKKKLDKYREQKERRKVRNNIRRDFARAIAEA